MGGAGRAVKGLVTGGSTAGAVAKHVGDNAMGSMLTARTEASRADRTALLKQIQESQDIDDITRKELLAGVNDMEEKNALVEMARAAGVPEAEIAQFKNNTQVGQVFKISDADILERFEKAKKKEKGSVYHQRALLAEKTKILQDQPGQAQTLLTRGSSQGKTLLTK